MVEVNSEILVEAAATNKYILLHTKYYLVLFVFFVLITYMSLSNTNMIVNNNVELTFHFQNTIMDR